MTKKQVTIDDRNVIFQPIKEPTRKPASKTTPKPAARKTAPKKTTGKKK